MNKELEYLRKHNPELTNNIEVINVLKQLREIAETKFDAPEPFKSILESWHRLKMFAYSTMAMDESPSLKRCWEDLHKIFHTFDDETFLEAYCFADFPYQDGKSFADIFPSDPNFNSADELKSLALFSSQLAKTRLGLYQVVLTNKKIIKLKESFTGKIYEVCNTIDTVNSGEMFLVRLFPIDGHYVMFVDPKVFPKEKKGALEDMVLDKAFVYYSQFGGKTVLDDIKLYGLHMKYSGPYWMSLVTDDHSVDILNPDYWQSYFG